jgi:hypothetical protein
MNFFPGKKGHFATKKRALPKTWGACPPLPPGSYAPDSGQRSRSFRVDHYHYEIIFEYLKLNKKKLISIVFSVRVSKCIV